MITAITAALLGAGLARRFGTKRVYLAGLGASLVSMALLVVSTFLADDHVVAYGLLLVATAFLGAGFGLTVPALNTFTAAFNPTAVDRSVLVLNALLGLGTVLAPVFVAIFVGLGFWWGLPFLSADPARRSPRREPASTAATRRRAAPPQRPSRPRSRRFWLFAGFAVLYGICETMNGNWSQLDMTSELGASTTTASLALTAFWAMVTVGRVLFAAVQRGFRRLTYHVLPFVLAAAFVLIALLPDGEPALGVARLRARRARVLRAAAADDQLRPGRARGLSAAVAGGMIAFYQLGYGIAAFGVGPLVDSGVELSTVYAVGAVVAAVMGSAPSASPGVTSVRRAQALQRCRRTSPRRSDRKRHSR